jgi:type IV pilus assembly protein PilA
MNKILKKIKKQKGFTLLELLAVLIIIAILGTGLYFVLAKVSSSSDAKTEDKNVQLIASALRSTYGNTASYTGLTSSTQQLITSGVFPSSIVSGTTLANKWGGTITLASYSVAPGTDNYFDITEANLPRDVCNKMASTTASAFPLVNINGTAFKTATVTNPDPTVSVSLCNNQTNTIDFIGQ